MSVNGVYRLHLNTSLIAMAKWEIKKRFGSVEAMWWAFVPGTIVSVQWPNGIVTNTNVHSADPNEHYRHWLEEHVGEQGWNWNWRVGRIDTTHSSTLADTLDIKFRKGKLAEAALFKLKFG